MKKILYSVIYMFSVTLVFAGMVTAVKTMNEDRIRLNQFVKHQKIILSVFGIPVEPDAPPETTARIFEERIRHADVEGERFYAGFGEDGELLGYAFTLGGPGFWGPIEAMAAVSPDGARLEGISFFRHTETPGLGARMTEPWFRNQFSGMALLSPGREGKLFKLTPPSPGKKKHELDAITGATQTSMSIEGFMNKGLQRFLSEKLEHLAGVKWKNG